MASLLEPYIPDAGNILGNALTGYKLGSAMRERELEDQKRGLLSSAGALAAGGNMKGARDTLYRGGDFKGATEIDDRMIAAAQKANSDQLAKAAKFNDMLGNLALAADTPEKWAMAVKGLADRGIDVSKYQDFSARDFALAQAGKTGEVLKAELERRKQDIADRKDLLDRDFDRYKLDVEDRRSLLNREDARNKPIEINGRLVAPQPDGGYKEVYAAPAAPKPQGLQTVSPGSTVFDPDTRQPIYTAPEKPSSSLPKPKTLGLGDITKLQEKGSQLENVNRYIDTFQDDNAGYGRGGDTTMWLARNMPILTGPTTEKAAEWWQDYDRYKNVLRNQLFGSALTAPEAEAFEKTDINPNMSPELIRRNLDRQREAVKSALRKTTGAMKKSGYAPEAVDEAIGADETALAPEQAAASPRINLQQPAAPKSKAEYDALPSGTPFIAPDGSRRTKP